MKLIVNGTPADRRRFCLGMFLMLFSIVITRYLALAITGTTHLDLTDLGIGGVMGYLLGWIWHD